MALTVRDCPNSDPFEPEQSQWQLVRAEGPGNRRERRCAKHEHHLSRCGFWSSASQRLWPPGRPRGRGLASRSGRSVRARALRQAPPAQASGCRCTVSSRSCRARVNPPGHASPCRGSIRNSSPTAPRAIRALGGRIFRRKPRCSPSPRRLPRRHLPVPPPIRAASLRHCRPTKSRRPVRSPFRRSSTGPRSITAPRNRPARSSSTRPALISISCSAMAKRYATASGWAARASPGREPSASRGWPSGPTGTRHPR